MNRLLALLLLGLCLFAGAPAARAQLGLPVSQLPSVGDVLRDLPDATDAVSTDAVDQVASLRDLRRVQVRELLRTHRRELEADPAGEPIVRSQILALGMSAQALQSAEQAGFEVVRRDALGEGSTLVTLRAPEGMSTARALRQLRESDPAATYDFDHLYLQSGAVAALTVGQTGAAHASSDVRVGLIDSGIAEHASLAGAIEAQRSFTGAQPVANAHGTAVASLILSAAPGARIVAADIYGGAPTGGASSALARALVWLSSTNTPVINVSLVGPRNRIVEAVIGQVTARGHIVVAAVGNDGPAAAPLYPAAYDNVVGVTGVDARFRVLPEAGRGAQVDFAALGVTTAAAPDGGSTRVRGTSFAAPIIAGVLARQAREVSPRAAAAAIDSLRQGARDAGARGRDDVYGFGVIQAAAPVAER